MPRKKNRADAPRLSDDDLERVRQWWIQARRDQGLPERIVDADTIAAIRRALAGVTEREQWRVETHRKMIGGRRITDDEKREK